MFFAAWVKKIHLKMADRDISPEGQEKGGAGKYTAGSPGGEGVLKKNNFEETISSQSISEPTSIRLINC